MIMEEYDEAKIQRIIARDAREEGLAEGHAKALQEAEKKDKQRIRKLSAVGMDVKTIAEVMEVTEETVKKVLETVE